MTDIPHRRIVDRNRMPGFELEPHALNDMSSVLAFLRTRRSTLAADITTPGPSEEQLGHIMEAAVRVPDHGKLTPWRFIILRDEARQQFASHLQRFWRADNPSATRDTPVPEADFVARAPLVVVVVHSPVTHPKIPPREQELSTGAACMSLLNAAIASGFAAQWRTAWPATDARVMRLLGVAPDESIAGFIFIGSRRADAAPFSDRRRPFWRDLASFPTADDLDEGDSGS